MSRPETGPAGGRTVTFPSLLRPPGSILSYAIFFQAVGCNPWNDSVASSVLGAALGAPSEKPWALVSGAPCQLAEIGRGQHGAMPREPGCPRATWGALRIWSLPTLTPLRETSVRLWGSLVLVMLPCSGALGAEWFRPWVGSMPGRVAVSSGSVGKAGGRGESRDCGTAALPL